MGRIGLALYVGLLGECSSLFNAGDLYAVLKVEKTATVAELKKAYRKLALKVPGSRSRPA